MARPFEDVESKWAARWKESRAYEPDAEPGTPKFFATYPYSYMNAFPHVGHAYTMTRVDFFVRYQRMLGKHALFPMGFHVTGTPIVAAADRVKDGEEKQIRILEQQGIPAEEIPKFADPEHWVRFFPKEWRQDLERLGLGVDWRREFHTTDLNPHYDRFIRWQFRRLREGGYVDKGSHPIIWCPKDEAPVADHDRYEGEGETPQEWMVYRMRLQDPAKAGLEGDVFLLSATLRPDTAFGQTNVWVDPSHEYRVVAHGDAKFIVNAHAADQFQFQYPDAVTDPDARVPGRDLVGLKVHAPGTDAWVPVLPATFIRHDRGTGIVTSVPSDSPQDYLSLQAVKEGLVDVPAEVRETADAIEVVPVIRTKKYGTESAVKTVKEAGARHHEDAAAIQAATEKAYQAGFYEGVMLENAGQFAGKAVSEAKEQVRAWLLERGEAMEFYWPSGRVVCRCLTPSVVKLVSDQWFIKYGDAGWKEKAQECLDGMRLYPEIARKQFNYVIGWLRDWACAREAGLGTRLPWDEKWKIESLSDSTIYMAYYTFAHLIEKDTVTGGGSTERPGVDAEDLTDAFFDYVLLGKGSAEKAAQGSITPEIAEKCRREFAYWYPLDFRNSGKDLVQNHLTFMIFNHVAVWPDTPGVWPRAIGVNGWVNVDGEKMSKSRGNFIMLRQAIDEYGTTATRLALANAGEGLDDANFDRDFAHQVTRRVEGWLEFARSVADGTLDARSGARESVDAWFTSTLQRHVAAAREAMDGTMFRTALRVAFYDAHRDWQWYVRRAGRPHAAVAREYVDTINRLLTPFVPHVAEEVHAALGKDGSAVDAPFPEPRGDEMDVAAEEAEQFVRATLEDAREILKVTGIAPDAATLYTAPAWKRKVFDAARDLALAGDGKVNQGELMKTVMQDDEVKRHGKDAPKVAQAAVKAVTTLSREELERRKSADFDEAATLEAAKDFLAREIGAKDVRVFVADAEDVPDPAGKARHAQPRRPAIHIEGASTKE